MNHKCYICGNVKAKIIERPEGYDGNHVICPECTHYKISRNAASKLMHAHEVSNSLSNKVRSHFEKTGEAYEVNTVTIGLL